MKREVIIEAGAIVIGYIIVAVFHFIVGFLIGRY